MSRFTTGRFRIAVIGCGSLLLICVVLAIIGAFTNSGGGKKPQSTPGIAAVLTATVKATQDSRTATATKSPKPSPTPKPTPTPTLVPTPTLTIDQSKAQYRGDLDIRDLYKNLDQYKGWKLRYTGTVNQIQVSGGTLDVYVNVPYGTGALDFKQIEFLFSKSTDSTGIYEGTKVTVWGRPKDMGTFINSLGGIVDQPRLTGDYIEKD